MLPDPKLLLGALILWLSVGGTSASAVTIETLAYTGAPLPGTPGESFLEQRLPSLRRDGTVTFASSDTRSPFFDGVWVAAPSGPLTEVVPAGAAAPGAGSATFEFVGGMALAPGRVGVVGQLTGVGVDSTNQHGIWLWDDVSGLALIEREGNSVPGTNGAVLADPAIGSWTAAGDFVYSARLVGGNATAANDQVLLRSGPSGTSVLLREGDPAPSLPGFTVQFTSAQALEGDSGRLHVFVNATGPSALTAVYRTDAAGGLDLLVETSEPAPGFPGASFGSLRLGSFSGADRVAFAGQVEGGNYGRLDRAIWVGDAGGFELAVREGDPAGGGFVVRDVGDADPVMDAAGRIVFEANAVDAGFDAFSSIVLYDPAATELELVARVDSPIPGMLDHTFGGFFRDPQLNPRGEIAFFGGIRGPGLSLSEAIFARLADGTFELIVRRGQTFEVAPGVFKTVENVNLANSLDARFLSDDGRLVFHLEFTDHTSGAFVAILPEPSAALLGLAALGSILAARVAREQVEARRDGERRRQ